ncbi:uncharacterized protein LOC131952988 [Physella acuta]|uniref:uncharacterized protein LOC131952988 n=1 Tax=Physella acuta TaxID=109671 RepID=UPI0027DAF942|nr:uncharacterized protein LOC131952988 [Physella acuta]XP_059171946.1 uncharacterized protein LOC131952988 [Physella acuta]
MGWVTSFLCVSIHLALAVVDLNVQEIQYVADHLTDKKCDQLMEALGEKTFMIHPERFTTPKPVQGHPEAPCVRRIRAWSKDQGKNMTFEFLALRLREIGLEKEADKLSRTVLGETVQELHRYFLDDPFKEMIPTKSFMVDKDDLTTKLLPVLDEEDKYDRLFVAVICMTVLCATLCMSISVCLVCPRLGHYICVRACPSLCSSLYDVMIDSCHRVWYGGRRSMDKYLFVTPPGGSGLMV